MIDPVGAGVSVICANGDRFGGDMRDLPKLVEQLSNFTVLEAAELSKTLQQRWEVRHNRRIKLSFNEGKVCDAIVRRLEDREQQTRADLRWPEKENHQFPVELVFKLGGQLYALEHTGIEPFDGHLRMEAQTEKLFAPITNALCPCNPEAALAYSAQSTSPMR
jgi:hypothetical protein